MLFLPDHWVHGIVGHLLQILNYAIFEESKQRKTFTLERDIIHLFKTTYQNFDICNNSIGLIVSNCCNLGNNDCCSFSFRFCSNKI